MFMTAAASIISPVLMLLPGAYVVSLLKPMGLSPKAQLSLCVVLSPLVVATEVLLLKLAGLPFASIVRIIIFAAMPGVLLLFRLRTNAPWHAGSPRSRPCRAAAGALLFMLLVACITAPWIRSPAYRVYGSHALMHTDICYQICRPSILPEEPELAGLSLAYPWFSHVFVAVVGFACHWPPTLVYPLTNIIWLAIACLLTYEACRAIGASAPAGVLAVGLLMLGTNIAGRVEAILKFWFSGSANRLVAWSDPRYTPFLVKYQ